MTSHIDDVIEGESRSVMVVEDNRALALEREPDAVIEEARRAASALKAVLEGKDHKVMMGGEQYLELEDWELLGRFYGVTAKMDGDPEYVSFSAGSAGEVHGFKASALALMNGMVISRATAFCLDDEEKWGERPKYAWGYVCQDGSWSIDDPGKDQIVWEPKRNGPGNAPKKERRLAGTERVPTFQLASMAQTRACAKVLGLVLRWVPVLAGYRGTPAEEIEAQADVMDAEHRQAAPPASTGAAAASAAAVGQEDKRVTAWRPVLMTAIAKIPPALEHLAGEARKRGWDEATYKTYLQDCGQRRDGGLGGLTFGDVLDGLPPTAAASDAQQDNAAAETAQADAAAEQPVEAGAGDDSAPVDAQTHGELAGPAPTFAEQAAATRAAAALLAEKCRELGVTETDIEFYSGDVSKAIEAAEKLKGELETQQAAAIAEQQAANASHESDIEKTARKMGGK